MWSEPADVYVVTANATIRSDGALVMGRGAALDAWRLYPGCNKVFGQKLTAHFARNGLKKEPYGVIIHSGQTKPDLAIFQVKWHYSEMAQLDLIEHSLTCLNGLANTVWKHAKISLNFPGIGNGGLPRIDVYCLIHDLPDNVSIWELPK